MFNLPSHFTSTYTKNAIASWPVLSRAILEKTTWLKDIVQSQTDITPLQSPLLSDRQIDDAFNGPYHSFFKSHLRIYAHISKFEAALTVKNEDFFKDAEHHIEKPFGISDASLSRTDFPSLKELRNHCDALTTENYAQWQSQFQNWTNLILEVFQKHNFVLSDFEIKDLHTNQPISEIEDRFINLKIPVPDLKKTGCDFEQYFILILTLVIQSALGRSQQPNTEKDIAQVLKLFHATLKTINKAEKELSQTQEKALSQLISSIKI